MESGKEVRQELNETVTEALKEIVKNSPLIEERKKWVDIGRAVELMFNSEGWKHALVFINKQLSMQRILYEEDVATRQRIIDECRGINNFLATLKSWVDKKNRYEKIDSIVELKEKKKRKKGE